MLTHLAFVLAVALVVARATMTETLRPPFDGPSSPDEPRTAGPATSLGLDLLACLPALLILTRRLMDRTYVLRGPRGAWSLVAMGALGLWTAASILWSADKFAAAISAANLAGAFVLLWSAVQLVRSWKRLRLVAGAALGLLLIEVAAGLWFRHVEFPEIQHDWQQNRSKYLAERGLAEGSSGAKQLEAKLVHGEPLIFASSPNTYAAVLVLLSIIAGGIAIQRVSDHDAKGFAVAPLLGILLAAWMLYYADSRTAWLTLALAAGTLALLYRLRPWLASHRRAIFVAAAALFVLGAAAFVGHGLKHDRFPDKSLTFRWYYWTGAAELVRQHPVTGVGWANFGQDYLAVRRAGATEGVKDPHNFIVRFFAETGVPGGVLVIAWVALLWWELTRPIAPVGSASADRLPSSSEHTNNRSAKADPTARLLLTLAASALLINLAASTDFSVNPAFLLLEMLRRFAGAGLLIVGMAAVAMRSFKDQELDDRPAPWILAAILVALGMFLLHNLMDFSLFEAGPMYLFALLAGSALGLRQPSAAGSRRNTLAAAIALAAACLIALAVAGGLWVPTIFAESFAHQADGEWYQAVQEHRSAVAAEKHFLLALDQQPLNGDYAYRAALAARGHSAADVADLAGSAIARNPKAPRYYVLQAAAMLEMPQRDPAAIRRNFEKASALDPRSVTTHIEYGDALSQLNDPAAAREQYQTALQLDDQLAADEVTRLPALQRQELLKRLAAPAPAP